MYNVTCALTTPFKNTGVILCACITMYQMVCALALFAVALAAPQHEQAPVQILKQEADVNPEGYHFE